MDQEFPYQHMFTPFVPTVEPAGTRDPFLNQYPSPDTLPYLEANWEQLASNIFQYNDTLALHLRGGALGDRLFAVDVGKLAQIHAQKSGQPTYLYRYSFRGEKSLSNMMAANNKDYGELSSTSADDVRMTEAFLDMIYSFSTTGNPKLTNEAPAWTPVTPGSNELNYLEIASPSRLEMKTSSDFGQRSFWNSLGFIENENYRHIRDEL
ncbi:hypothetical protein MSG28_010448 [Choristoneura fumiferana]|uniref:Uncharacterized protein n=1 Tax=Choristoneura fumiferana TaxID=7141 RepID=A0ACC0KKM7_CHOFU|nr:hypothetical protein MSG28_010448 [Choristoneura fumiferana]